VESFGETRVGYDAAALIEHGVADETVDEVRDLTAELLWFAVELGERLGQAVGDLHVAAVEGAPQLVLVVARHTGSAAVADHSHHQTQDPWAVGAAVDEVADEERLAAGGMDGGRSVRSHLVAELGEQRNELLGAAVDVTDEVERPVVVTAVGPPALPFDPDRIDLVGAAQNEHASKPLALEALERLAELLVLAPQGMRWQVAIGPARVALGTHLLRNVEHDRDREHVVFTSETDQR
jgi:hypothetical protein